MTLAHFPLNPDYGRGCYRRLLRLAPSNDAILVTVDDTHHAMWLLIGHDGDLITSVEANIGRGPATSCSGSVEGLQALVGKPLTANRKAIAAALPPTCNCTHLSDLAVWAMWSAAKADGLALDYEISVADDDGAPYDLEIRRNGHRVHAWQARGFTVVTPDKLAGMPLMRGFIAQARTHFSGDVLEAAIMLQRGLFVARGRRHLVDLSPPVPLLAAHGMENACFSYTGIHWRTAQSHVGYVRDFTDGVRPQSLPPHLHPFLKGGNYALD